MIRYYITDDDINQPQVDWLKNQGYHIYGLRDWEGREYGIEPGFVYVNSIGLMITDTEIPMPNGFISSTDFFNRTDIKEIKWDEIKEPFEKYRNTNFHYHIKGLLMDEYYVCRTYSLDVAKEKMKKIMISKREKDRTAKAYRFGYGKHGKKNFYKRCYKIPKRNEVILMDKIEEIKGRLAAVAHKDSIDGFDD